MQVVFEALRSRVEQGKASVLAVVLAATGSVPRESGAAMLVGKTGWIAGTVGGGMLELRASEYAGQAMETRTSFTHRFVLNQKDAEELGMVCGGEADLLFLYLPPILDSLDFANDALKALEKDQASWMLFEYGGTQEEPWARAGICGRDGSYSLGKLVPKHMVKLLQYEPVLLHTEEKNYLAVPLVRPGRVVVFGGGHLARALVPLLAALDFTVLVYDDRPEFARPELFPGARLVLMGAFERFEEFVELTSQDYAVVVTRGHAADYTVLERLLRHDLQYVGVVGSRTKTRKVNEKLLSAGISAQAIDAVHTPIGIAIQAKTPAEIAVSIAAELILVRAEGRD